MKGNQKLFFHMRQKRFHCRAGYYRMRIKGIKGWMNSYPKELDEDPSQSYSLQDQFSWRKQTLERQELFKNQTQGFYPSEIHVLRIGDVAVCTNQFELYTEYGLRILGRSDASMTCVQVRRRTSSLFVNCQRH